MLSVRNFCIEPDGEHNLEKKNTICEWKYMQPDINYKMRDMLIDWMCKVSIIKKYNCLNSIPFAVIISDLFLTQTIFLSRNTYQLIGICSLTIANYIINNSLTIDDKEASYLTDGTYTPKEVCNMLKNIIKACENRLEVFTFKNVDYNHIDVLSKILTLLTPKYDYKTMEKYLSKYFPTVDLECEDLL